MSEERAIRAGEEALYSLKEARDILSSASNWGLLDIFSGNGFTGFMKHMKIISAHISWLMDYNVVIASRNI